MLSKGRRRHANARAHVYVWHHFCVFSLHFLKVSQAFYATTAISVFAARVQRIAIFHAKQTYTIHTHTLTTFDDILYI